MISFFALNFMDDKAEAFFQKVEPFLSSRRREILRMKIEGAAASEIGQCFGLTVLQARRVIKKIDKQVLKILEQASRENS